MELYELRYTEQALKDIEGIFDYITNNLKNYEAAKRTRNKIVFAIETLAEYPQRGGKLFKHLPFSHRFILSGNYLIAYNIDNFCAQIIRVLYKNQDISTITLQECIELINEL